MNKLLKILLTGCLSITLIVSDPIAASATAATDTQETEQTISAPENVTANWPQAPAIFGDAAVLMDASTNTVLYNKNMTEARYPASITKIMTVLLALENCSLDETVTFSHNAVFSIEPGSSNIGIKEGEQLTMEQCLYGIMLESANEVSNAVAEHIDGSVEAFAQRMTSRAKELGAVNTNFVNANGLHDDNHYTCAYDMALITSEALKNETFCTISGTYSYVIPPTNITEEARPINHKHKMIPRKEYAYDGCIGGKTGRTDMAKNTLVTYAKRGDLELVCVVLHSDPTNIYSDTELLLDYGFNNFQFLNISQNETNYQFDSSSFYSGDSSLFGDAESIVSIDSSSGVVIPNTASFTDLASSLTPSETPDEGDTSCAGTLTYTYNGYPVGSADINITLTKPDGFSFSNHDITQTLEQEAKKAEDNARAANQKTIFIILACVIGIPLLGAFLVFYIRLLMKRKNGRKYSVKRKTKHYNHI